MTHKLQFKQIIKSQNCSCYYCCYLVLVILTSV